MTEEQARLLAEFIKDHDKRFEAKAKTEGHRSFVLLTRAADGTTLEPVTGLADYERELIERNDPGPTVRAAWAKWRPQDDPSRKV